MIKKWSKSEPKTEQKKTVSVRQNIGLTGGFGAVFEAMGPSKNAYFEDVKKLLKMPKNGPKMIQEWFKIAQIV